MMAEVVSGHTEGEAAVFAEVFRNVMHGKPAPAGTDLGDLEALEGVKRFPVRVKCALLPWVTLLDALRAWRNGGTEAIATTETEEANR
jgi:nitrogen fixation NifU-like protein